MPAKKAKSPPSHDVFIVEGQGENAFWTKIGAAWPHEDGKGLNVQFNALPLTGRVVLRVPKERESKI